MGFASASQLFAVAAGRAEPDGPNRCFYCAAPCGDAHPRTRYLSSTFTGWGDVAAPQSPWLCAGCVLATAEPDPATRPRLSSWLLTPDAAVARSKAHIPEMRRWCLAPPTPPFAIVLATSGQKQLIYRAPVNRATDVVTVQLELERVTYAAPALVARLALAKLVCAASGKPALAEPPSGGLAARLAQGGATPAEIEAWFAVAGDPLSRLVAFVSPNKEECLNERSPIGLPDAAPRPAVRRRPVAAEIGGPDGPGLFGG